MILPCNYYSLEIQEIAQSEEIDINGIIPLNSVHLLFYDHVVLPVLNAVIAIHKSNTFELHHAQETLNSKNNDEVQELPISYFSANSIILPFLNPSLEVGGLLETITLQIEFHPGHVQDLRLHLEDLLINYIENSLKIIITTLIVFHSRKASLMSNQSTLS